uniref:Cytochrome P450 n=1 Tax=Moniliophthora roreri TaxID=221103 RepID=A0A0W0GCJ7_MONRR
MDGLSGLLFALVAVFVTSCVIKLFNGLQTVNHIPGYRPPFTPFGFPGVVLPTRWWNTGLDMHFVRRYDMYKEREYMSLVPFISGKPAIWSNNLDVAKQVEAGVWHCGMLFQLQIGCTQSDDSKTSLWGTNLAASNGEAWRKHRRVMGPAFNVKLYRIVWEKTREIYKEMVSEGEWATKREVDVDPLQSITYKLALIILGTCGFGLPGSWIKQTHDAHYQLNLFMKEQIELRRSRISDGQIGSSSEGDKAAGNNLLNLLVQASEDEEGKYQLNDDELISNVFLLLLAGHETTANALAATFGYLAVNPHVQQEIYQHIIDTVGHKDIEFEDYAKLNKVVSAFIEAVRLIPGGHVLIREAAEDTILEIPTDPRFDSEGAKLGRKQTIPVKKGTEVVVDMIGLHRNPRYFEDPEEYRPSRWYDIPNDSELFTGFSVGPRACIGRKFATAEAVCYLTMLLRDWDVKPLLRSGETENEWRGRCLVPNFSLTLGAANIGVKFIRRPQA